MSEHRRLTVQNVREIVRDFVLDELEQFERLHAASGVMTPAEVESLSKAWHSGAEMWRDALRCNDHAPVAQLLYGYLSQEGIAVDPESPDFALACRHALRALAKADEIHAARIAGNYPEDEGVDLPLAPAWSPAPAAPAPGGVRGGTARSGDAPMPAAREAARDLQAGNLNERQRVQKFEKDRVARCGLTTVNKHLDNMHHFMLWLNAKLGWTLADAFKGQMHSKGEIKNRRQERRPYADAELRTLFETPLFTGCFSESRRARPGRHIIKDADCWVPLILMFTGARREEICQLYLHDVVAVEGIWCFQITDQEDDQGTKSNSSNRTVAIRLSATAFAAAVQAHWTIENRNHEAGRFSDTAGAALRPRRKHQRACPPFPENAGHDWGESGSCSSCSIWRAFGEARKPARSAIALSLSASRRICCALPATGAPPAATFRSIRCGLNERASRPSMW